MIEYIVADYLNFQRAISEKDAKDIVKGYKSHNEKLGTIALNMNLLTEEQVDEIHDKQKIVDKKFGEIAVDSGMLTEEQLNDVICMQRKAMDPFEFAFECGIINIDMANDLRNKFKEYYKLTDEEFSGVMADDVTMISSMMVDTRDFYTNYYYNIAIRFLVRFLGLKIGLSKTTPEKTHEAERIITHKIRTMRRNFIIGFSGSREAMHALSESLSDFDSAEFKNDVYARLKNFVNCITCVFECGIMRESPIRSISCVKLYKSAELIFNEDGFVLPANICGYPINIIVASGAEEDFTKVVHNV